MQENLIAAFDLAGFFAAHGIWCVSDGSILVPMLAYEGPNGERQMDRLLADELTEAVEQGKQRLESNEMGAQIAVLVYDGYLTGENEKLDALFLDIRDYAVPDFSATMAVPYGRKKGFFSKFKVHRPKLVRWEGGDSSEQQKCCEAFFKGVDSHEKGVAVWNKALDESK